MSHTFEFDPWRVLAIGSGANLQEIREAYRHQSKKYHPDHGGDEWAFRLVSRSYEILSRARVAGRALQESTRKTAEPLRPHPASEEAQVRPGPRDRETDPGKIVDVELLLLRLELSDPMGLVLASPEQRNLSCCLNVRWPGSPAGNGDPPRVVEAGMPARVAEAFDRTAAETQADSSWQEADESHFSGWIGYPTARRTDEAARYLREALAESGMGINQWTRELIIPRDRA